MSAACYPEATETWPHGAKVLSYNSVRGQSNWDSEILFSEQEIILFTDLMFWNSVIAEDKLLYRATFGLFELL